MYPTLRTQIKGPGTKYPTLRIQEYGLSTKYLRLRSQEYTPSSQNWGPNLGLQGPQIHLFFSDNFWESQGGGVGVECICRWRGWLVSYGILAESPALFLYRIEICQILNCDREQLWLVGGNFMQEKATSNHIKKQWNQLTAWTCRLSKAQASLSVLGMQLKLNQIGHCFFNVNNKSLLFTLQLVYLID